MSTVNSTTTALGAIAANNKGMGGMISGMDTEELIKTLTMGTRSKIAKQQQNKQTLQWRQTAYRDVSSLLVGFQEKWVRTNAGAIGKNSFFQAWKASFTPSSSAIEFKTENNYGPGSLTIKSVDALAEASTFTTKEFKTPKLTSSVDFSTMIYPPTPGTFTGQELTLTVNGKTKTIDLSTLDASTILSAADVQAELDNLLAAAFGSNGSTKYVYSTMTAGELTIEAYGNPITVADDSLALGFTKGQSNQIDANTTLTTLFPGLVGDTFVFKINGTELSIGADKTIANLLQVISYSNAGVNASYSADRNVYVFTSKKTGAAMDITFEDVQGNLMNQMVGVPAGSVYSSGSLGGISIAMANSITSSDVMNNTDFLDAIWTAFGYGSPPVIPVPAPTLPTGVSATLNYNITVNGVNKALTFDIYLDDFINTYPLDSSNNPDLTLSDPSNSTAAATVAARMRTIFTFNLNDQISTQFPGVKMEMWVNSDNQVLMAIDDPSLHVTIGAGNLNTIFNYTLPAGFPNDTNLDPATPPSPISAMDSSNSTLFDSNLSFTIALGTSAPVTISGLTPSSTILQVIEAINTGMGYQAAKMVNGKLVIDGNGQTVSFSDTVGNFCNVMFGASSVNGNDPSNVPPATAGFKDGKMAMITVEGPGGSPYQLTSDTNDFLVGDIGFTVKELTSTEIKLIVDADTDGLVDKIKDFIDDYNDVMKYLNSQLSEKKNLNYTPLSDEQKAELTKEEIEQWEAEAKKGILRGDSHIRQLSADLRACFYTTIESIGLSPQALGLRTASMLVGESINSAKSGLIELTDANEKLLRDSIENNLDAVRLAFTDPQQGIAKRMNDIIVAATNTSSVNQGTLVFLAGTEDTATGAEPSVLEKRIASIDETISRLKLRLENEYNRYWKQFSALEVALQNLSTQSGWLNDLYSN